MDDDETKDRFRWEAITSEAVREAHQSIGRGKVYTVLNHERDQETPPVTTERVIVF